LTTEFAEDTERNGFAEVSQLAFPVISVPSVVD
jgi:hypothetical protein